MKDIFLKYSGEDLWSIKEDDFHKSLQSIRESQFALGNGFIGIRGVLEEIPKGAFPGTYFAGVYDRLTSQVSELVNFPNPFNFKFVVNGEKLGVTTMDVLKHKRVLNMRDGLLLRHTVYMARKKRRYDYQSLRFVSMHDKNMLAMQVVLTPLDDDAEVEVQTGIDIGVQNSGVMTEGSKRHFVVEDIGVDGNAKFVVADTLEKTRQIIYWSGFYYEIGKKKVRVSDQFVSLKVKKNQPVLFTMIYHISAFAGGKTNIKKNKAIAKLRFLKVFRTGFDNILNYHIKKWNKLWKIADVVIEGTADIQKNIRFNVYHLLLCTQKDEGFSSIGARTLSGEGYRGHIFWDAEIFTLPFYLYTLPGVAKNMLLYRYNRMDYARAIAKKCGYQGVMFPWESAGTGEEETPTWAKNLDGSITRIRTNELEHHITADIAYAVCQYYQTTGDNDFMNDCGYEMLFESARFWASRVTRNKKKKYEIRDVIGPDEFHEHVDNNAYTNLMVKWNLLTGYKYYIDIKERNVKIFSRLTKKLSLTDREVRKWKYIVPRININMRKDNVIEQFDGFFKKRYIEIVNYDENNIPALPHGVKVKDYNKTQLVKQADVLMVLYLLSDIFNRKTKESNFWYYVRRTLHKSSLSASIHALMAVEVGAMSQAYQFFNVALRADISNLHGNSDEGIHAASLGGVWQAVVHGFAGVRGVNGMLYVNPRMPKTWHKIRFSLVWRNDILEIGTKNDEVRIKVKSKKGNIKVNVFGEIRILCAGKIHIFKRGKKLRGIEGYY